MSIISTAVSSPSGHRRICFLFPRRLFPLQIPRAISSIAADYNTSRKISLSSNPVLLMARSLSLLLFLFFVSSASACDRCVRQSNATYFSSPSLLKSGACGYAAMATELYGKHLAAAPSSFFRGGLGCGGCFQIRCKNAKLCSTSGVKVVVTDAVKSNQESFVLSLPAFSAMAKSRMQTSLRKLNSIDVEYKRIPCEFPRHNLSVRVEEKSSKISGLLVIKFLYQGGQTDIVTADVAPVGVANWEYLTRDFGAVWSTSHTPPGALQLRLRVTGGYDGKWVWSQKALPANWRPGIIYDTGVQINDIAQEGCFPCDSGPWTD